MRCVVLIVIPLFYLQHGQSWHRRSLIEDAKFDTVTNIEFERQELSQVQGGDVLVETEDDQAANGEVKSKSSPVKKCSIVFALREMNALSRVFKTFEVRYLIIVDCCNYYIYLIIVR